MKFYCIFLGFILYLLNINSQPGNLQVQGAFNKVVATFVLFYVFLSNLSLLVLLYCCFEYYNQYTNEHHYIKKKHYLRD